jgi:hypothetical protein
MSTLSLTRVATWHHSPGTISLLDRFCNGEEYFEHFWEVRADHTQFNPIYSRSSTSLRQFVDVTALLLERKTFTSAELVTGRTLMERSMLGLRNYKKAGSLVGKYLDDNGSPKLSGWDMSKVWTKVLDDMWDMLMSKKNDETKSPDEVEQSSRERALFSSDEEDDDTPTDRVTRPAEWFFPGWMAFASYYPTSENKAADRAMDFLGIKEPTEMEKKKLGRSTARVEKEKAAEFERTRDANRGMSKVEEVLVKTCEIQGAMHQSTKSETKLFSLNVRADRIVKQMQLALERGKATEDYSTYDKLQKDLDTVNEKVEDMENNL